MTVSNPSPQDDTFLDVFKKHDAVMLIIDPERGEILDANPAAERFYGYSLAELKSMTMGAINLLPPEQVKAQVMRPAGQGIRPHVFSHKLASGEIRTIEAHASLITLNGRSVMFAIIHDVTNREQAEERYGSLFELMMDGIYRSTHDGRFVDVNPAMVRMFGYDSKEEMLQVDIKTELYFSPDERGSHILDTGQREIEVYRMRRKDGSEIWVEDHGYYVHDEQGNILYHEGLLRDVTERVRAENALRESERRLKEAQSIASLGSYVLDFSTGMWTSSATLDKILGIDGAYQRSVEGWAALIHPDHQDEMTRYFAEEVVAQLKPFNKEYKIIRQSDGEVRWVHGLGALELDTEGTPLALTGTIQDITERKQMEDDQRQRLLELESLYETSNALAGQTELKSLLQFIVETAKKMLNSASSGMFLFDPSSNALELTVDTSPNVDTGIWMQVGEGLVGHVALTRKPMRIADYSKWEGRSPQFDGIPLRALLEVPMLYSGELIGVLTVSEYDNSERVFTDADERLLSLFASQAAGAIHSARLREDALRRLDQLQSLRVIDKTIASNLDARITMDILLSHAQQLLGMDAVSLLLLDSIDRALHLSVARGFRTNLIESAAVSLNDDYAGRVFLGRQPVQILDRAQVTHNPPFLRLWEMEDFHFYFCMPLIIKGEVKGVIEAYRRSKFAPSAEWLEFFETIAGQAAIAIDNAQMFNDIQRANMELAIAYESTIENWSRALGLRGKDGEAHTRRATELTLTLAKIMGVSDSELPHIRRGALLHDIGTMGIPDSILHKKGKLTDEEEQQMRSHPMLAFQILNPIHYLRPALDIPYCHHEHWDGTGYPRGLKDEQIPLAARIFAVADAWDVLISPGDTSAGRTKEEAAALIQQQSGTKFDPQVVQTLLQIMATF